MRIKKALRRGFGRGPVPDKDDPPWWESFPSQPPSARARIIECVVDDRAFLLGLDELYRDAMKKHERGELLACARRVATALGIQPADVAVEGYYAEDADLTTYFRLLRALQAVPLSRASEIEGLPDFHRLLAVTSSPIFGPPSREGLLPKGKDPLSAALDAATSVNEWTVPLLTAAAATIAQDTDDCSFVGLACHADDAVVLAALRESVVLYAMDVDLAGEPWPQFQWRVDPDLCTRAQRFVDTFNGLFGRELPPPASKYAHAFASGVNESRIIGRCVRLGQTDDLQPKYYHWAVAKPPDGPLMVDEFWASGIWTTERYRRSHPWRQPARHGIPPSQADVSVGLNDVGPVSRCAMMTGRHLASTRSSRCSTERMHGDSVATARW